MTIKLFFALASSAFCLICSLRAQKAVSLKGVRTVAVGSLGSYQGAEELQEEVRSVLRHSHSLRLATSRDVADAVIEGHGELWIIGRHSLSPRARVDPRAAEPIYDGYLSVKLQGNGGATLWSYLTDPGRVSIDDLKHELATQVVHRLVEEIAKAPDARSAVSGNLQTALTEKPVALHGAGATFPAPVYADWFATFRAKHPNWQISYDAVGSGEGLQRLLAGGVDFAGSDIPPAALPSTAAAEMRAFPTVGGAVVLIYNLPELQGRLKLTSQVIARIYSGAITRWNDPELAALNSKERLPNAALRSAHRSDNSGTTYAFTEYLSKTESGWKQRFGAAQRLSWPVGGEAARNEGMAQYVAQTKYSIGYVEFIYALRGHLSFASLRNPAGRYIEPDLPSIMAAANSAVRNPGKGFDLSISNSSAPDAYPISTFSWLLFNDSLDGEKRPVMYQLLEWALTSGQRQCSALGYAPLPDALSDLELSALRKLRSGPF